LQKAIKARKGGVETASKYNIFLLVQKLIPDGTMDKTLIRYLDRGKSKNHCPGFILPAKILNPFQRFCIANFSQVSLGGRKMGMAEQD
jgi:hypothetical protein